MSQPVEAHPFDSCHRCGLRRRTRELEAQGIVIRLCDDCYWGREDEATAEPEAGSGATWRT
jgi:hypothetical protein